MVKSDPESDGTPLKSIARDLHLFLLLLSFSLSVYLIYFDKILKSLFNYRVISSVCPFPGRRPFDSLLSAFCCHGISLNIFDYSKLNVSPGNDLHMCQLKAISKFKIMLENNIKPWFICLKCVLYFPTKFSLSFSLTPHTLVLSTWTFLCFLSEITKPPVPLELPHPPRQYLTFLPFKSFFTRRPSFTYLISSPVSSETSFNVRSYATACPFSFYRYSPINPIVSASQ